MKKFLIATHRSMADGIKDTITFFTGTSCDIKVLSAYIDDNEINDDKIKDLMTISDQDQLVIFTDIASGSVTQKFYPYVDQKKVFLISGVNLPIILSVVLSTEQIITEEFLDGLIVEAKEQLVQIKQENPLALEDE